MPLVRLCFCFFASDLTWRGREVYDFWSVPPDVVPYWTYHRAQSLIRGKFLGMIWMFFCLSNCYDNGSESVIPGFMLQKSYVGKIRRLRGESRTRNPYEVQVQITVDLEEGDVVYLSVLQLTGSPLIQIQIYGKSFLVGINRPYWPRDVGLPSIWCGR